MQQSKIENERAGNSGGGGCGGGDAKKKIIENF